MSVMELPAEMFVRPVDGHPDTIAFRFDFALDAKALGDGQQVVTESDNGDLIIEGYAAVFEGLDRENENFAPGAFERGIKAFLGGQSGLCFHHKHDKLLGKVLGLQQDGKGLKMKARVDAAIRSHPELGVYYEQIKNGSLNALSVGGFFKRMANKIVDMDFTEISVTPVPVHPGTNFAVVAGKALASDLTAEHVKVPEFPEDEMREDDFMWAQESLASLDRIFDSLAKRGDSSKTPDNVTVL